MATFWENVLRVIAVIGLLAVLLLGAWGIIQIAFFIPSFFGNFSGSTTGVFGGSTQSEAMTVSVPVSVVAEQQFNLHWSHTGAGSGQYSYTVAYSCADGLSIAAPVPTGAYQNVPCNTPFNYVNASTSMSLIATLASGTKSAQTTFTVAATDLSSGAVTVSGTAATTVTAPATVTTTPAKTTTTAKTSTAGSTYYASGRTTNLYGYSDLAVFINSANSQAGNATVIFTIENIGTNVSPSYWSFNAILPINGTYTYPVGGQQALYPGDRIVYTLHYSDPTTSYNNGCAYPANQYPYGTTYPYQTQTYPYNQYPYNSATYPNYQNPCTGYTSGYNYGYATKSVSIQVDPQNLIPELNKANNYASATYIAY